MNHPFKTTPFAVGPPAAPPAGRLSAAWSLNPATGRPVQAWRQTSEGPLSSARLGRPALRLVKR